MKRTLLSLLVVGVWSIGTQGNALAGVIYTYTGNDFSWASYCGSYTDTDQITGSITFASALPDNLELTSNIPTIVSFDFDDGVRTITDESTTGDNEFMFVTDASGNIVQWNVQVNDANGYIESENNSSDLDGPYDQAVYYGEGLGVNSDDPGTWTGETSAAPEPATLALLGSALAGLGLFRRRRGD